MKTLPIPSSVFIPELEIKVWTLGVSLVLIAVGQYEPGRASESNVGKTSLNNSTNGFEQ